MVEGRGPCCRARPLAVSDVGSCRVSEMPTDCHRLSSLHWRLWRKISSVLIAVFSLYVLGLDLVNIIKKGVVATYKSIVSELYTTFSLKMILLAYSLLDNPDFKI